MSWLVSRLREPSTHAGVAALLQVASTFVPQYKPVFDALTFLFGTIAVAAPEVKSQ